VRIRPATVGLPRLTWLALSRSLGLANRAGLVGGEHFFCHCGPQGLAGGVKDGGGRLVDPAEPFQY
jgi:hypothetical protein